jgi:Lrp/AsnC family leucine-responsive transcriptional regulator
MDAIDREIIRILAVNGRASHVSIGKRVSLSPNAVADRMRRLMSDGIVTGVHAAVDPRAVGRPMTALIELRLNPEISPDRFEELATALDGVQEIAFLTGRFDFQLRVACRDAADLDRLLRELRATAGVAETETRLVLRDILRRAVPA